MHDERLFRASPTWTVAVCSVHVIAMLGSVATTAPASAGQTPTAAIDGTVADASKAVVAGASVTAESVATSARRAVRTDARGRYRIDSLEPGEYRLEAALPGFSPSVTRRVLQVGDDATVDFTLHVGGLSQDVEVTRTVSGLNTSHSVFGTVGRDQIETLPLNGRHVLDLARLEPGVAVESVATPGAFGNNYVRVSVAGASFMQTRVAVDGATIDDRINGGTAQNFSQESIQEFQVSSFNFDLTTGVTAAGSVNAVSRRGGNLVDGSAFVFYRDHRLAAYPALNRDPSNPEPLFSRKQFGFSVGGPLRRGRLFWFANAERNDQDGVVASSNNHPIFSALDVVHPTTLDMSLYNVRLDATLTGAHTGFLRVSADRNSSIAPTATTPRSMPSHWLDSDTIAVQGLAGVTSVLSPRLLNDLRLSYGHLDNRLSAVDGAQCSKQPACIGLGGPEILIFDAPAVRIGHHPSVPKTMRPETYQLTDTVSWQRGSHSVRLGGEWEHLSLESTQAFFEQPELVLWGPTDLLRSPDLRPLYDALPETLKTPSAGPPTIDDILKLPLRSFSIGVGDPRQPGPYNRARVSRADLVRVFAQDAWTPRHDLTVTYGAAYSYRTDIFNQDLDRPAYLAPILGGELRPPHRGAHAVDPSAGLAWTIGADQKTVLRGGAGRYRDELHFFRPFLERGVLGPAGNGRVTVDGALAGLSFLSTPTAFTGADLMPLIPGVRSTLAARLGDGSDPSVRGIEVIKQGDRIFAPDHTTPYAVHASAGVQRELAPATIVTADYVMRRYSNLGGFHHQFQLDRNRFNRPRVLGVNEATGVVTFVRDPVIPLCTRDEAAALDPGDVCSTGPINVYESRATSRYQGLHLRLDSRFRPGVHLTAGYALATHVGFVEFTEYGVAASAHGNLADHRRHRLTISGVFEMPRYRGGSPILRGILDSWTIGIISQTDSAPALGTILAGLDLDGDGISRTLLPGTSHNTFGRGIDSDDLRQLVEEYNASVEARTGRTVGPDGAVTVVQPRTPFNQIINPIALPDRFSNGDAFITQDVRVTKVFGLGGTARLSLSGEVFNLFNAANLTGYSNVLNQPNYGQPSARAGQVFGPGGPRAVQLATRLAF